MENIGLMDRYWKKKDEAIASQVRKNWQSIEQLIAAHPYALNPGPIRPGTPRMVGLHPDHPNKKIKPQRAIELDLK